MTAHTAGGATVTIPPDGWITATFPGGQPIDISGQAALMIDTALASADALTGQRDDILDGVDVRIEASADITVVHHDRTVDPAEAVVLIGQVVTHAIVREAERQSAANPDT